MPIRWYGVMYIVSFSVAYLLYSYQIKRQAQSKVKYEEWQNCFFWSIMGLLLGARIFSCLFYGDASYYLTHPWMMFWPFSGGKFVGLPGMSYHGGVIGVIVASLIYCRIKHIPFMRFTDFLAAAVPLGYTFGRLGNFINAELYGRVTSKPWGMIFPAAPKFSTNKEWVRAIADKVGIQYTIGEYISLPRHPSQLYEAFFEGIVLFLILWFLMKPLCRKKRLAPGTMFGSYLFGYGFIRFIIEYFRQPDAYIGYVFAWGKENDNIAIFQSILNISKGQVYCFLMIVAGLAIVAAVNILRGKNEHKRKAENA